MSICTAPFIQPVRPCSTRWSSDTMLFWRATWRKVSTLGTCQFKPETGDASVIVNMLWYFSSLFVFFFCRVGVFAGFKSRAHSDVPSQPPEGLSACRHQHVCSHHQVQYRRDRLSYYIALWDEWKADKWRLFYHSVGRKYQLVFCYTIIERNSRHLLPVVRSSVGGSSVSADVNPLDTFFPFDPYLLKRCFENHVSNVILSTE